VAKLKRIECGKKVWPAKRSQGNAERHQHLLVRYKNEVQAALDYTPHEMMQKTYKVRLTIE